MFKNHFRLAWRNLIKNRLFSFLNLVGLSVGLACAALIYLWVSDERSVNRFNEKDGCLYQVMQAVPDGAGAIENTPGLLAAALPVEMPEVEYAASVIPSTWFPGKGLFSFNGARIRADGGFVSKDFFSVFSCPFIEGSPAQLFVGKNSLALSRELAVKLFGTTTNLTGKTIEWNQQGFDSTYVVSGVFENLPSNATLRFDAVFNYAAFLDKNPKLLKWTNNDPSTYVLLKSGADPVAFNKKISGFIKGKNEKSKSALFAQRFSDTYLYNRYENGIPSGGRIGYVKLFSVIAVCLLLVACINFMNLSTAKALKRIKEVGVQKIVGASRRSLIVQYLSESLLMAFLSLLLAIGIVVLLLPAFNGLTGKQLGLHVSGGFLLALLGVTLITGVVAGSYPALYISGFRPALIVKGTLQNRGGETSVRKILVVTQFAVSAILIVSVLVIYQQMQLIQTTNLGYQREQVIYFEKGGKLSANKDDYKQDAVYKDLETFVEKVKRLPGVVNASNFRHSIVNRNGGTTDITWPGKAPDNPTAFTDIACGYDFIETLGIAMKEGRPYSKDYGWDKDKIVFNEAAVKAMGLQNPVGKTVTVWGRPKQIIGVTKDFHFQSLYETIKPCFFDLSMNQRVSKIMVRIQPGNEYATLDRLAKFYKAYTGESLDVTFLDSDYQALYASEKRVASLSKYFAGIAIVISCLGLFGLAAFTAQKRRKEIGIRKVIGASVTDVTALLSKDFLKPVLLSLAVAFPLSWWAMHSWLQGFAYRVSLSWAVFATAGFAVLLIALATVSFQSVRAAITNPVKSLRTE